MKQNRAIIQVKNLRQFYKNFVAVNGIDFEVYPGEIFGLIGTNGAGKTSIIKALSGVQTITSGTVEIMGKNPSLVRSSLGYLTQQFSLYSDLSIDENLHYYVKTRRLPEEIFQSRRKQYLQWLGLTPFAHRVAGHLSGGMKQKLALCCILITKPRILLLDEVSTGIDAVSRHEIWSFLSKIAREGTTIVVSTHYLDEAERCDRVALIHRGNIREMGTPEELKHKLDLQCFEVVPDDPFLASGAIFAATEQALKNEIAAKSNFIVDVQSLGDRLIVFLPKEVIFPEKKIQEILNFHQLPVTSINPNRPTLENVMAYNLQTNSSAKARFPEAGSVSSLPSIFPVPGFKHGVNLKSKINNGLSVYQNPKLNDNFGSNCILNIDGVSKAYGKFQAVQPLNLKINRGEICGLLGANGAGKTTLMKLLCGLLVPSGGKIGFTSEYLPLSSPSVKQKIGYMSQKFALYPSLTILENLSFFGRAYGVSNQQLNTRIAWLLETFELTGYANVRVANLSGGNKQRVAFGAAILHQPHILFLDEPTSGMDILVRRHFWQILQQFARQGTAIVVTTHSMEEAEYCTNLLFIRSGKLIIHGSPKNIKMQQQGVLVEILSNYPKKTLYNLEQLFEPWRIILMSDRIQIILEQASDISQLENYLAAIETESYQINPIPFSLEAAFLKIAKHP